MGQHGSVEREVAGSGPHEEEHRDEHGGCNPEMEAAAVDAPAVAIAPIRLTARSAAAGRVSSPTTSNAPHTSSNVPTR